MITEETIRQTRFYRGIDNNFYLVSDVQSVKLVTLLACSDCKKSQLLLGEEVCEQFVPVEASFKRFIESQLIPVPAAAITQKSEKQTGRRKPATTRGGKAPSSLFKGVEKLKIGYSDGRSKFRATFRNPETKKQEVLGHFDNEYLAAAKYQERAGNLTEARRLYDLAEQANNNPDRTKPVKKEKITWVCKRCGSEYQSKGTCGCGCDDMREVKA